jgi:guanylate kinase
MIKTKQTGELIIVSGTTCAGKDTVVKKLLERNSNIIKSTSYTSRPIRPGEIDGENYYFTTKEGFEEKIKNDDFLEYAKVQYGQYYGTPKKEVIELLNKGKDIILVIDVQGAKIIKEKFPETLLIFILAPSMKEIKKRLLSRSTETKEQIIERFKIAYQEINEIPNYNYVVVNDDIDECVEKVNSIIISNKLRVDRIEELSVENQEEFMHELLMDKDFENIKLNYGE